MSDGGAFVAGAIVSKILLDNTGFKAAAKEVTEENKKIKDSGKEVGEGAKATGLSFGGLITKVGGLVIAYGLFRKAGQEIVSIFKDSIKEAIESEQATVRLGAALEITGREVAGNVASMSAFAQAQQQATLFTDEQVMASETLLVQLTKLDNEGIQKATKGAIGLAATLGIDLEKATMLVYKASIGNTAALGRYGLKVDETLPKEEKFAALLEKLAPMYGRATAETNTFGGQLTQLGKAFDEAKETIGGAIISNEALQRAIKNVTAAVVELVSSGRLSEWVTTAVVNIEALIYTVGTWAKAISDADSIVRGSWFFRDVKSNMADAMRAAREEAVDFQSSLKVLKPTMDAIQMTMEAGPAVWKEWSASVKATDAILAANKDTIIKWIDAGASWLGLMDNVGKGGYNLGEALRGLGIKTREQLTKELDGAEKALAALRGSIQSTPGQVKALEDKIAGLKSAMSGAKVETRSLAEELGLLVKADLEKKFDKMVEAVGKYKDKLTPGAEKKLMEDLVKLRAEIDGTNPHIETLTETLDKFFEGIATGMSDADVGQINTEFAEVGRQMQTDFEESTKGIVQSIMDIQIPVEMLGPMLKAVGDALGWSANSVIVAFYNMRVEMLRTIGIVLPYIDSIGDTSKDAAKKTGDAWQEVSTVVADACREIAKSIVESFNITGFLETPKMGAFDSSYFDGMTKAADEAYDKATEAARSSFDEQKRLAAKAFDEIAEKENDAYAAKELLISRHEQDLDIAYKRRYDREREAIQNSKMTEEKKDAALLALEIKYEDAKLARERKAEDAKLKREEAHEKRLEAIREAGRLRQYELDKKLQDRLIVLQAAHDAQVAGLRIAEDTARQKHADDEEKRQGSLWTKVKGIFATAINEIATMWITDLIAKIVPTFGGIKKAADDALGSKGLGKTISGAASSIGTMLTTLATSIGTVITTLATAIGTGLVAIATGIAGAIVALATGIASAATIIAAAAPAIIVAAAIGVGIMASLAVLKRLIAGSASGAGDGMGRVVERQDQQTSFLTQVRDLLANDIRAQLNTLKLTAWQMNTHLTNINTLIKNDIRAQLNTLKTTTWKMETYLKDIAKWAPKIHEAIKSIQGGQQGLVLTSPQLVMTHGTPERPEFVVPEPDLRAAAWKMRGESRQAASNVSVSLAFHVSALDGADVESVTRGKIVPILQKVFDHYGIHVPAAVVGG